VTVNRHFSRKSTHAGHTTVRARAANESSIRSEHISQCRH